MNTYPNWTEAHFAAQDKANSCQLDVGIWKTREYGKEVFRVGFLPRADKRFGYDLQAEVVNPQKVRV